MKFNEPKTCYRCGGRVEPNEEMTEIRSKTMQGVRLHIHADKTKCKIKKVKLKRKK